MKIKDPKLFGKIKDFLTVYLPIIRSRSPNTVAAYKTTMNLYLVFIRETQCKQLADIMAKDFNHETILVFLAWLKTVSAKYQGVPNTFAPTPITDARVVSILL